MTQQVLVDAEALAKVLMLLPHDAISHLPDEARAAQSLRNALTQPQPSSSAGEKQEGVEAGLNGCVGTHNPYTFGPQEQRDAWERGNARVREVFAQGYEQGKRAAELFASWQPQPAPERPAEAELDAVRGYLMDIRAGSHTVGNMRYFAKRYEHGDPSDIPESWKDLPDKAHVTKAMHAEVLWRAFRRAALATQPQPEP